MRALADRERIERLMEAFGRVARRDLRVYLVGGATAVLLGWRPTTIDVDLVTRPEDDALLRAIPGLKEELEINVELASPLDFIPVPHGWEDRGTFIKQAAVSVPCNRSAELPRGGRADVWVVAGGLGFLPGTASFDRLRTLRGRGSALQE